MCPMRIFLVLFSALLASYLAWRNYNKTEKTSILDSKEAETEVFAEKVEATTASKVWIKLRSGFWSFVDMATGRSEHLTPDETDTQQKNTFRSWKRTVHLKKHGPRRNWSKFASWI
ncbi:hypothetical protein R1flu_006905 [Riccia fluitans]|uniref:Uncharacterized protein n=1 Tax=Riccia fluitans TaxID=41844 RepID=A0ABD1YXD0_9MARC